ncbi:DNA cytosine methyltransferase [Oenococcus oeni]
MKFLDLFAGIGGFRLGLEEAGHTCVGYVEWDKFARQSYQAIFNTEGEYTEHDIRAVRANELPKADIWTFGFPCQDISVAGKQKGIIAGKRSSLFFATTSLIRGLEEKDRPSYLFIENVKNLLSINKGFDFARILIELDEIGYDAEWSVLDSAEVTAQHRERIFIIGHLRSKSTRKVFPIKGQNRETTGTVKKVGNIRPNGKSQSGIVNDVSGKSRTLTAVDYKDPMKAAVKQVGNLLDTDSFGGNPQVGRVYDPTGKAPTLNTMQGGNRQPKVAIPVLTPDRLNKRQNGRRFKTNGEPEFTLNTQDRHGIYNGYTIRRLTPLECWRLQGFPDWAFNKAKESGMSDSQLYKQAGNSVTVPVIKAIAEKLDKVEEK